MGGRPRDGGYAPSDPSRRHRADEHILSVDFSASSKYSVTWRSRGEAGFGPQLGCGGVECGVLGASREPTPLSCDVHMQTARQAPDRRHRRRQHFQGMCPSRHLIAVLGEPDRAMVDWWTPPREREETDGAKSSLGRPPDLAHRDRRVLGGQASLRRAPLGDLLSSSVRRCKGDLRAGPSRFRAGACADGGGATYPPTVDLLRCRVNAGGLASLGGRLAVPHIRGRLGVFALARVAPSGRCLLLTPPR